MKPDEREKLIDAWAAECKELLNAPPLPVQLDPMVAIAIISQIQLASRHPENNGWMMTQAVEAARVLQTLFSPTSVTARVLELGWDVDEDVLIDRKIDTAAEICEVPCEDFIENRGCRCTGFRVADVVSAEEFSPEQLAGLAAHHHAVMEIVRSALMDDDF
ncbi:hypothetical protein [Phormidium nigroviride]